MRRLSVFNSMSLDGFIADATGDMSWAHRTDDEWNAFVRENASSGESEMLFGRVTYDLMASYWPTDVALKDNPVVAKRMNESPKVVFSRTMQRAEWSNTRLVKEEIVGEVRRMKTGSGPDMIVFGSGTVVAQLAGAGLVDLYQIAICPIVLGSGKAMFAGLKEAFHLRRVSTRAFKNGNVYVQYRPA
jgi:dihydrofolate reductase